MATEEAAICAYIPRELLNTLNEAVYKKGISRSAFIKNLLLDHFSEGNEKERIRLLGRDKKEK